MPLVEILHKVTFLYIVHGVANDWIIVLFAAISFHSISPTSMNDHKINLAINKNKETLTSVSGSPSDIS